MTEDDRNLKGKPVVLKRKAKPIERDPAGVTPEQGAKYDDGKLDLVTHLLSQVPLALKAVARHFEFGTSKYCVGGWQKVPNGATRYRAALHRHALDDAAGQVYDIEGRPEPVAIAWNALTYLELCLRDLDEDERERWLAQQLYKKEG